VRSSDEEVEGRNALLVELAQALNEMGEKLSLE